MNRLAALFRRWLEASTPKQKLTVAVLVFSVLSTLGLMVITGSSVSTGDPLESNPLYFISVFVKLIVVLLLIVASSVIFRRWLQPGMRGKGNRQIKLLETVQLSPKQAIHLITIGDQQLLVGATDQGISVLTQVELNLDAPETEGTSTQPAPDFASLLQTFDFPHRSERSS